MPAGTFRGCFKRHTRLHKLFLDGENVSQVCRNFLRTSQKACIPAETSFGRRNLVAPFPAPKIACAMFACGSAPHPLLYLGHEFARSLARAVIDRPFCSPFQTMLSEVPGWYCGNTFDTSLARMCFTRISANTSRKSVVRARSRPSKSRSGARLGHRP